MFGKVFLRLLICVFVTRIDSAEAFTLGRVLMAEEPRNESARPVVTGGNINGAIIGSSSPAAGNSRTGTFSGNSGSALPAAVDSVSLLRSVSKTGGVYRIFVTGYRSPGDGGGGWYSYAPTDSTSADNGGTIIVGTDGGRWYLNYVGRVSLKQFGAKIDGATNDDSAVQAIVAAAKVQGFTIYEPKGTTLITTPVAITTAVQGWEADGGAALQGTGSTTDSFTFAAGNYPGSTFNLPTINNFPNGICIRILGGAGSIYVNTRNIAACLWAISIETSAAHNTNFNHTIRFNVINGCTNATGGAIQLLAYNSSSIIQGMTLVGNFVNGNTVGIYFNSPAGSSPAWNTNIFRIDSIDGASVANSRGIYAPNSPITGATFDIPGFFGGFTQATNGGYIDAPFNIANSSLNLGFDAIADYTKIIANGNGVFIRNTNGLEGGNRSSSLYAAATSSGARATFNGGAPVMWNEFAISLSIPSLSAGATADFYVYSPFTDGYSDKFWLTPHYAPNLSIESVEDATVIAGIDGNTSPNQIHIRVRALAAVTAFTATATLHMKN